MFKKDFQREIKEVRLNLQRNDDTWNGDLMVKYMITKMGSFIKDMHYYKSPLKEKQKTLNSPMLIKVIEFIILKNFHEENFSVRWLHCELRGSMYENLTLLLYKRPENWRENTPQLIFLQSVLLWSKSRKIYCTNIFHQGGTPITFNRHANLLNKMLAIPSQWHKIISQNQVEFIPKCLIDLIFWNQPIKKLKEKTVFLFL